MLAGFASVWLKLTSIIRCLLTFPSTLPDSFAVSMKLNVDEHRSNNNRSKFNSNFPSLEATWTYLSEEKSTCLRHSGTVRSAGSRLRAEVQPHTGTEAPGRRIATLRVGSETKRRRHSPLDWSLYYRAHCRGEGMPR